MNPRIMKKLSKRVAVHAKALGYSIDLDGPCEADYTPKGASRKPSHRSRFRHRDGGMRLRGMLTPKLTPWFCWTDYGPDGGEGDGAIAWQHAAQIVRGTLQEAALDWSHPCVEGGEFPPYIEGKAPKLPHNTWQMLRAIEHQALVEKERKAIRALRYQRQREEWRRTATLGSQL
ncbi:MAG TPA: hypothetical protein DCR72_10880 [Pseudomonas sp.]|nr:hypothetical protein [Pseudomonas sp.]